MPLQMLPVFIMFIAFAFVTVPQPARAEENSGTWRGKWWNYYERGISKSEAGNWTEAADDLSRAIRMRDKDQRRARTYGMHFIDYFPHRELGIACLQKGDIKKALAELEKSYSSEESAKAAFYLNTVRRTLLQQQGAQTPPPLISLASPLKGQSFRDAAVRVSGQATAASRVASLRINGMPYRFDLARERIDFFREVPLEDDDNQITIEATDLLGSTTRTEIPLLIDREGPSISLTAITRQSDKSEVRIRARLSDISGISKITVNGRDVAANNATDMELDTIAVIPTGAPLIRISAVDLLGNETTAEFDPDREQVALSQPLPRLLVAMNGTGIFSTDKEPPLISLKDSEDLPLVYIDRYYVAGEAFDNTRVERITINGRDIQIAKGKKVFFSKMVKLKEGNNKITVEAVDGSGNRNSSEFTIKRVIPSSRQASARMSLSVLPFDGTVKNSTIQGMVDDFLVAALVDQKRFQVVEREKLKQILQEQKLAKEKLTDPEHSIRIGKLLSADAMLATTVAEGQKSLEVTTRLISTETAEIMETKDVYIEDKSLAAVKELMEGLASKLTLGFPVVEGIVVKRERGTLFSDLGSASGIRRSMATAVYRRGKEIKHPVSGKSLGWDMVKIGDGTIEDVQDSFSKIRLHDKVKTPQDVQVNDTIITR
jgi:hypothetical protein